MEEVIAVNDQDEVVGLISKDEAHKTGVPHRIAVTYVENAEGKFLVQVRMSGTLDHSSAGHLHRDESYEEAAKRELAEELGIKNVSLERIGHGVTDKEVSSYGDIRIHVFDAFRCTAEPINLQINEVKEVYWADAEEVFRDMQTGESGNRYTAGFRTSLPLYLAYKSK